jgi:cytoskeletal protein CcmA (bactofilin family)
MDNNSETENPDNNSEAKSGESESLETLDTPESPSQPETSETQPSYTDSTPAGSVDNNDNQSPLPPSNKKPSFIKQLQKRLNIYLLLFILIVLVAGGIILVAYVQSRQATLKNSIKSQNLSQSALQQLANSDSTVGNNQSVLNVESSAIFAGQVLIKKDLDVAGNLNLGGTLTLNSIDVKGASQFGQATINNNLSVAGNSAIQGSETISKSLQVGGSGNFSGNVSAPQVVTSGLQLNGNLVLTHHISTNGSIPTRSNGPALGAGGSASVSGTDTAGSVTINTGGNPAAGCFITINFSSPYSTTPHVLVTPIGSSAGGLSYYVNRSTTNFSICDASIPPSGSSFGFDYFVID